ncbi:MAG: ABC transporter ATP-binding protein [Candidatus Wallbacteria bacterium]
MPECVFKAEKLTKEYIMGDVTVTALKDATFEIKKGEFIVVLGPSGSGKSTLLNIMGGMDKPSRGSIKFKESDISNYNEGELTKYRRNNIGFVFQFYNLMPNLTAFENVELATEISPAPFAVETILEKVGLTDKAFNFPAQMSGGEQQRVAIARAIAKNPDVLLCDEPTGALDYVTGVKILKLLSDINRDTGKTVIVITHNQPISQMADRVIKIRSGEITTILENNTPLSADKIEW